MKCNHVEPNMFTLACALNLELFSLQYLILKYTRETALGTQLYDGINASVNANTFKDFEDKAYFSATKWNVAANTAFGLTAFLSSNVFGMLCDYVEINKVIICTQILHYVPIAVIVIADLNGDPNISLQLTIVFMILFGILGGVNSICLICRAYIAQMFTDKDQIIKFGILEAMNIMGTMIPNVCGGYILDTLPFLFVPLFVFIMMTTSTFYTALILNPARKTGPREQFSYMNGTLTLLTQKRCDLKRKILITCSVSILLTSIAVPGANALMYLYVRKSPLHFTNGEVGIFCGLGHFFNGIGLIFILPFLKKYIDEVYVCNISLMARSITYIIIAFVKTKIAIFCTLSLAILCNLEIPILWGYATAQVEQHEKARLLGFFASFQNIGFIVAQFTIIYVYFVTLDTFSGAAYILCSLICIIIIIILTSVKVFENLYKSKCYKGMKKEREKLLIKTRIEI